MKKRIGVVLSGCGVYDGSEIHESVLTLLAIDKHGAEAVCMAPDIALDEVDHLTGTSTGARRNVLVEAARIARGHIVPLSELKVDDIDGAILPGGFGAAQTLCDFATAGAAYTVHPEVSRFLRAAHQAGKPLGFICIAPAIAAERINAEFGYELGPESFVIVGDTPRDVSCARHFGARVLAVASGTHTVEQLSSLMPDATLPDLRDTDAVLRLLAEI